MRCVNFGHRSAHNSYEVIKATSINNYIHASCPGPPGLGLEARGKSPGTIKIEKKKERNNSSSIIFSREKVIVVAVVVVVVSLLIQLNPQA